MTKNQIKVALLQKVRKDLVETDFNTDPFICVRLSKFSENNKYHTALAYDLKNLISRRLQIPGDPEYISTLEAWLLKKGYLTSQSRRTADIRQRIRLTRIAWVDSLIEEFSI